MRQIQRCNNSIHKFLLTQKGTFISFGSEFRNPEILHPLLCHHPNWPKLRKILEEGSNWPLLPINKNDRPAKNKELIERGNHKSALKYNSELKEVLKKEVKQGWMIPLPLTYISSLRNGELAPVGMDDKQWNERQDGTKQVKLRLTHDQSFDTKSGVSVNARVISKSLEPLYYGGCLSRVIHYIVSLRICHPYTKILGGKSDIKAAYRRITLHGDTAELCTIMYDNIGLTSTRLTFGGSPCPNEFCLASELCTDLANDILHCPTWDPDTIGSPHAKNLHPPILSDELIPHRKARELDVKITADDWGRIDDFIDDGIVIVPDLSNNKKRALEAMLLAIHILFRPLDKNEQIKRDDCLSLGKLHEEGFLSENPTILGWEINTRKLTISLPQKKIIIWDADLLQVIKSKKTSFKALEKLIGRLNHAATACPLMRYFLNRIRKVLVNWQNNKMKTATRYLPTQVLEDLKLWHKSFLPKIREGMSLNLITYRRPSVISWSDACPTGLGGFNSLGHAWQNKLQKDESIACKKQNNSLEFVSALITVWLSIFSKELEEEACFLALSDNTSAVSWLHKSNVDESKNSPLHTAARKFADVLLQADCCLYSQHLPGQCNTVADFLSRNFDRSNDDSTTFILSSFPSQVPPSFKISPLPPEILSWLTSWLQKCKERMGLQKTQGTKKPESGEGGTSIQNASVSPTTYGFKNLPQIVEQSSSEPLLPLYEDDSFQDLTKMIWRQQQCKRPLQNW